MRGLLIFLLLVTNVLAGEAPEVISRGVVLHGSAARRFYVSLVKRTNPGRNAPHPSVVWVEQVLTPDQRYGVSVRCSAQYCEFLWTLPQNLKSRRSYVLSEEFSRMLMDRFQLLRLPELGKGWVGIESERLSIACGNFSSGHPGCVLYLN